MARSTLDGRHEQATNRSDDKKRLLKPDEAADRLAISTRTLYRLVAAGVLTPIRLGRSVRFDPADLDALVAKGGA